jgi:peptide/nickel transport system permease protein
MTRFLLRRLVALIPILFLVSTAVFFLDALIPGDAATELAGGTQASAQSIAQVRAQLHLNQPLIDQYGRWMENALHLNFGESLFTKQPVTHVIFSELPVTLSLMVAALAAAVIIGVPLGILSGLRPGGANDKASRIVATLGIAIPSFWLAALLIILFAVVWKVLPSAGYVPLATSPLRWLRDITLPALTLGLFYAAVVARQLRSSLLDVMDSNYVRTAWAIGGSRRSVVMKHALKNAASPTLTVLGLSVAPLLGGAVIVEQIFSIPGMGTQLLEAITSRNLPMVQGIVIVFVLIQLATNTAVDVAYGFLNPRVRVR